MSARPWYKRYPADFIAGTLRLSLEEKGAYSIILDLMYDQRGPLMDDSLWIARACGCSTRKWNQIRERLIAEGKITVSDGKIYNDRATKQILSEDLEAEKRRESGVKGAEKTNEKKRVSKENNNIGEFLPEEKSPHTRSQTPEKDSNESFSRQRAEAAEAFAMFNEVAGRAGLPRAQVLSKAREGRLIARLRDCGGLEGWAAALAKIEASDFCTGRKTNFKAGLDFMLQESSFTKLMEGNYDNVKGTGNSPAGGQGSFDNGLEGFGRAAAKHAESRHGRNVADPHAGDCDLFAERKGGAG